ncbi:hypothetical protein SARC_13608, partial [Sphaeroforma arctica JP610]
CATTYIALLSACYARIGNGVHQSDSLVGLIHDELIRLLSHTSEHVRNLAADFWYREQKMPAEIE